MTVSHNVTLVNCEILKGLSSATIKSVWFYCVEL